jgi:hypothetical protein
MADLPAQTRLNHRHGQMSAQALDARMKNTKPTWQSPRAAIGAYAKRVGEQSRVRGGRPITLSKGIGYDTE